MKIYSLCSSSKGNCTYIENGREAVLIDAGFGIRNLLRSLALAGLSERNIRAVFITHEHTDHISGLKQITERWEVPVYGSRGTLQALLDRDAVGARTRLHEIDRRVAVVGDLVVTAFHKPHDCADGLGFCVSSGKQTAAVCTDLGEVTEEVRAALRSVDFLLLESNYDPTMLRMCRYPDIIKDRIASSFGHLSNDAAATLLAELIPTGAKTFLLGHLSEQSNLPELALQNAICLLQEKGYQFGKDYELDVAPVRNPGKVIEI